MIKYIVMSEERKKEVQNSLSKSNVLLERYHSYIAKRHGRLGFKTLSNENFTKIDLLLKIVEASKTHPNQDFAIENTIILAKDVREIAASKLLEEEIISSISPMLSKITKKYSEFSDVCLDREDLYCEAVRSALTAIYTYQGDKRLSTYLYTCVSNEIRNLCNKTSPFSKVGKNAMKIKRRFEDAKNDLGEFATFDEIVNYAKLSSKETLILQRLSVTIAGQSSIDKEDGNSALDYSFLGKKFMGMDGTISFSCSNANSDSFVIRSDRFEEESPPAIDLNELTELERIVLQGFMESSTKNLGINSLAKKLINPKTGKPYSRMAITFAWRRVKEKISKTLKVA